MFLFRNGLLTLMKIDSFISLMNVSSPMMLQHLLHQCQFNLWSVSSKTSLSMTRIFNKETTMAIQHIISLLEFCLRSTCFVFQGKYYEQVEGVAMGSPLSAIVANIFMKDFETKALETPPHTHVHGKDLLMLPLLSYKQHTKKSFSNISTPMMRTSS